MRLPKLFSTPPLKRTAMRMKNPKERHGVKKHTLDAPLESLGRDSVRNPDPKCGLQPVVLMGNPTPTCMSDLRTRATSKKCTEQAEKRIQR